MQSDEKMQSSANDNGAGSGEENTSAAADNVTSLDEARAKAEKATQDALYLRAEFENSRRRLLREQELAVKFANEKLIQEIGRVVDLFDRAILSSEAVKKASAEAAAFVTGIELTQKELLGVLEKFGVEFLGRVGDSFDPNRYEAVSQVPVTDPGQVDKVIQVLQRGFALHGRTLMPAKVVVGIA